MINAEGIWSGRIIYTALNAHAFIADVRSFRRPKENRQIDLLILINRTIKRSPSRCTILTKHHFWITTGKVWDVQLVHSCD